MLSLLTSTIDGNECLISRAVTWPSGKEPTCALNGRLGGPQRLLGCFGEEKSLFSVPAVEPSSSSSWPCQCIDPHNQINDIFVYLCEKFASR